MCGTSTKTNNTMGFQSGVQSTTLPAWATGAGQDIYNQSADYAAAHPYQAYSGQTEGQFGDQWGTATDYATGGLGQTNGEIGSSNDALRKALGIAGNTAGSSIQDLMSPYTEGVLRPTLTAIGRDAANRNNATAAEASMSGAFGDSGFGVQRALNDDNTQRNIGDATASAYNNAFNNAQTQKNTALNALMTAAGGLSSNGNSENANNNTLLQVLQAMGSREQGANAEGIATNMLVNNEQNNGQLNQFSALQNILRGAPMDTTTTSVGNSMNYGTATQPDNTGLNVAGNLAGKALFGGGGGGGGGGVPSSMS